MEKLVLDRRVISMLISYYNRILEETEDPIERMRAQCYLKVLNYIVKNGRKV